MIAWLNPVALFGLVVIAGPVIVHLLRRRRAERLSFPSLRFISGASTSSVRFRIPADPGLLMLRIAIVGLAAAALAQPSVMTSPRAAAWTRAVVVDGAVSSSAQATEAAVAEAKGSDESITIRSRTLRDGLQAAVEALTRRFPSRREVVLVSDFRHGALTAADLANVPAEMGVRFVEVGQSSAADEFPGATLLGVRGVPARVQAIRATREGTDVRLKTADGRIEGIRLETTPGSAELLLRSVARAGAPAPSADEPIALSFAPNAATGGKPGQVLRAWMVQTALRMRRDSELLRAARTHVRRAMNSDLPGIVVARDAKDLPLLVATQRGAELLIQVAAPPEAFVSAATLRSALFARAGEPEWNDHEVARIPSFTLASWTRAPRRVSLSDVRLPGPGDARVVWGVVLGLLVVETFVRKSRRDPVQRTYADAA